MDSHLVVVLKVLAKRKDGLLRCWSQSIVIGFPTVVEAVGVWLLT